MDLFYIMMAGKPVWMWAVFAVIVIILITLDLGVLQRKPHKIGVKESLWLSAFYISAGLLFGVWVWWSSGAVSGKEYFTAFLIEKSLSVDNLFVMSMIFSYFAIPAIYQHRVLLYGILGVIILRGIMIGLGVFFVTRFHWILYIFAAFLIYTGVKMLLVDDEEETDIASNPLLRIIRKTCNVTDAFHGQQFVVRQAVSDTSQHKSWFITPLLVALIMIEIADIMFAFDSIPAVFAITTDPFVIYTSNIFAILGLRALYFALAACFERFKYLKQSLSIILIFIGSKVFVAELLGLEKFPAGISLGVTLALLAGGVVYSLHKTKAEATSDSLKE